MRAKISLAIILVALIALAAGCSRGRSDAQIAGDVQGKVNADPAAQSRCLVQQQCKMSVSNGVVTLDGTVASDAERSALANDAAQVEGVKTVVNNLQVGPQMAAAAPEPQPAAVEPAPEPAPAPRRASKPKPSGFSPGVRRSSSASNSNVAPAPVSMASDYAASRPVVNTPPPPPKPVEVTIPEGSTISIRLIDPIDSEKNQTGDHFRATLDSPIVVGDAVAIPAGADIYGRVTNAKSAAHFAGRSELALELTRISLNGKSYELHTDQFSKQGTARGKNTAAKVGGGAALGAIIGGIAGGGKGAVIGATVGAGAGGTAQAVTKGQQIKLTSEQVLAFHLESPLTVAPTARLDRNQTRQRLDVDE